MYTTRASEGIQRFDLAVAPGPRKLSYIVIGIVKVQILRSTYSVDHVSVQNIVWYDIVARLMAQLRHVP
jgi:hypothetical protein